MSIHNSSLTESTPKEKLPRKLAAPTKTQATYNLTPHASKCQKRDKHINTTTEKLELT